MSRKGIRAPAAPAAVAALAAVCLVAASASAEPVLTMEEVVVTATRTATPVLDSPDTVTVITAEEVAAAHVEVLHAQPRAVEHRLPGGPCGRDPEQPDGEALQQDRQPVRETAAAGTHPGPPLRAQERRLAGRRPQTIGCSPRSATEDSSLV